VGELDFLSLSSLETGDEPLSVMQLIQILDWRHHRNNTFEVSQIVVKKAVTFTRQIGVPHKFASLKNMQRLQLPQMWKTENQTYSKQVAVKDSWKDYLFPFWEAYQ